MHGAEVPADFSTDSSENNDGNQPQQSSPRVDRVCDFFFDFFSRTYSSFLG